ncbi:MAG TPA: hypothetical protein VMU82_04225 [Acetobacteraceae bacterium]|nr:hypothetical protein [Acetobacteraceae bacterium]
MAIIDSNALAVAGSTIEVTIDHTLIGTFAVIRRSHLGNGFHSVFAPVQQAMTGTLTKLFRVGGRISFRTNSATYTAPLNGGRQLTLNMRECGVEAEELGAANRQKAP